MQMINRKFVFQTKQLRAFQLLQTEIASQLPEEFFERLKLYHLFSFPFVILPSANLLKWHPEVTILGIWLILCDHIDKDNRSEIWSNGSAAGITKVNMNS